MRLAALAQAEKAAERLESSVANPILFEPTWTGSNMTKTHGQQPRSRKLEAQSRREAENNNMFGRNEQNKSNEDFVSSSSLDNGFGGANIVGAGIRSAVLGQSSSKLLSNLRKRRQEMASLKKPK